MKSTERLAIWKAANEARAAAGKGEILWGDFRAFVDEFIALSVGFDAVVSDAIRAQQELEEA